jgi:hypothetical protein
MCEYNERLAESGYSLASDYHDKLIESEEHLSQAIDIIKLLLINSDSDHPTHKIAESFIEDHTTKPIEDKSYTLSELTAEDDLPF